MKRNFPYRIAYALHNASRMAVTSEIMNLAMLVMKHTKEIDDYVTSQGLPTPSFGIDAPLQGSLSGDASKSRELVLGAIEDLHALIAGPLPHLMQLLSPAVRPLQRTREAADMFEEERLDKSSSNH